MMTRIAAFLLMLFTTPAWATFTLGTSQTFTVNLTTTPTAITVTSRPTGHLIIIAVFLVAPATVTACSGNGGGTCTVGSCNVAGTSPVGSISCAYILATTGATTSISLTSNTVGVTASEYINDYAFTSGPITVDGTPCTASNGTSTNPAGCAPTGNTGTNDVVLFMMNCGQTCSTVTGTGWTSSANPNGNCAAAHPNTASMTPPNCVSTPTGLSVVAGIAFKETVAAIPNPPHSGVF